MWVLATLVQGKCDVVLVQVSVCFSVCSPVLVWCNGGFFLSACWWYGSACRVVILVGACVRVSRVGVVE